MAVNSQGTVAKTDVRARANGTGLLVREAKLAVQGFTG